MGRAERLRKAAEENSTPVNSYQATDDDLPEILQPKNGGANEPPKLPPQNIASAPSDKDARPRTVAKITHVTTPQRVEIDPKIIETFLRSGDLNTLSIEQRLSYYTETCRSLGLNPLTRPFDFISLNGKIVMYAKRDCTDQLRKTYSVSITSLETKREDGIYIVTAHAVDGRGRVDTANGAVPVDGLRGNDLANAIMKAETKAKRRVTLSLCGLGILDESEIESERVVDVVVSAPSRDIEKPVGVEVPESEKNSAPKQEIKSEAKTETKPEAKQEYRPSPLEAATTQTQQPLANGNGQAASADAYQPLPEAASNSERLKALEAFCFKKSPSDNRLVRYLPFAVGVPVMLSGPYVIEENGKWNPKKWEAEGKKLADRAERLKFMEQQLSALGREMFIKWGDAMVESARKRGVFGK